MHPRHSPFGYVIGLLGLLILAGAVLSGVVAFLAHERPEKGIEWHPFAFLTVGLLVVTGLFFGVAWYKLAKGTDP